MATSILQPVRFSAKDLIDKWKSIPPLGAPEEKVKEYLKRYFNDLARLRRYEMARMARNLWFYRGRQWIEVAFELTRAGSGGYSIRDIKRRSSAPFPMPVDNHIGPGVDNEVARLGRKEWVPTTIAERQMPEWEAAARLAKNVLLNDLREQEWPSNREQLAFDMVIAGTCIARSVWDSKQTDLTAIVDDASAQCPTCQRVFASRKIPKLFASLGIPGPDGIPTPMQHTETLRTPEPTDDEGRPDEVELTHCPMCEQPSPLQDYSPSVDEIQGGNSDVFDRPLGQVVPRGEGLMEPISPWEGYPENGGMGVEPHNCRLWGIKKIRSLDWVASRHPDVAGELEPESPRELLKQHPTMSDPAFATGYGSVTEDIYSSHINVIELSVDPLELEGLEDGRHFYAFGADCKIIKDDGPLMVPIQTPDGKTKKISKTKYAAARYKRIPQQFWGQTPVDDAVQLNRRLNQLDAQMVDIRERGGPIIVLPAGAEIYDRSDSTGALRCVEVDAPDPNWNPRDGIMNGQPLTGNVYMEERNMLVQGIRDLLGPQQFEQGQNPAGVTNATQLQIIAEQSQQSRGPRERALTGLAETIWSHHLEVTWAFRREDATYQVESDAGEYERDSYTGTDLMGGTKVKIEAQAAFDSNLFQASMAEKAVGMGIWDISDDEPAKDKISELMGLPKIKESTSVQVLRSEQAWSKFLKDGEIPVVDETVIDPWIWFQVLGKRWQSDDGMDRQRDAGWSDVVRAIAGWPKKLQQAQDQDQKVRAIYEGFPPEQWAEIYDKANGQAQIQNDAQKQAANIQGMQAPPPISVPPPPQSGQFLPDDLSQQLLLVWGGMLGMDLGQSDPMVGIEEPPTKPLLQFYAVIQQCRILAENRKSAAMAGAPPVSAPGGGRTQAGTEPSPGSDVVPTQGGPSAGGGPPGAQ